LKEDSDEDRSLILTRKLAYTEVIVPGTFVVRGKAWRGKKSTTKSSMRWGKLRMNKRSRREKNRKGKRIYGASLSTVPAQPSGKNRSRNAVEEGERRVRAYLALTYRESIPKTTM